MKCKIDWIRDWDNWSSAERVLAVLLTSLFLALPLFIRLGWGFWLSLVAAIGVTAACYAGLFWGLRRLGIVT